MHAPDSWGNVIYKKETFTSSARGNKSAAQLSRVLQFDIDDAPFDADFIAISSI
jgi:hypothetical protein